ncbi:MAG: hypothetical protein NZ480_05305, partial [Bdellovibrionaceae bacterium]|nr:hypothetical protein [Pseudobdellovibrionaceae bacterium]
AFFVYIMVTEKKWFPIFIFFLSTLMAPLLWLALDYTNGNPWLKGYYAFQFSGRFFNESFQSTNVTQFSDFTKTLLILYSPWLLLLAYLFFTRKDKSISPLQVFFGSYTVFLCLAFGIIRKDSLQHYTGFSLFLALTLTELTVPRILDFLNSHTQLIKKVLISLNALVALAVVLLNGVITPPQNKWEEVRSSFLTQKKDRVYNIVMSSEAHQKYDIFWSALWHWRHHRLFIPDIPLYNKEVQENPDYRVTMVADRLIID